MRAKELVSNGMGDLWIMAISLSSLASD